MPVKSEISGHFSSFFPAILMLPGAVQTWSRLSAISWRAGGLWKSFGVLCANIATWLRCTLRCAAVRLMTPRDALNFKKHRDSYENKRYKHHRNHQRLTSEKQAS
jgi:hypothetical protein